MKEKLLKLIYLELKNLDTLKFHDLAYHGCNAGYESSYTTSYIDGYTAKEKESAEKPTRLTYKYLCFSLKFPDGKPDVKVYSSSDWKDTEVLIKKRWLKPNLYQCTREVKITTFITCGHVKVELTKNEFNKLYDKVIAASAALEKYSKMKKEKDTLDKIEARIAKHNEK